MCFLLPRHFIQKFNLHPAPAEQGWFGDPHPVRSVSGGSRGDSDAARLPSLSPSRQVADSLTLTLLCCGAGRTPRARGPQCSRSASPAPARSALQAGRSRARIPSACPPARPLARPPASAEPGERAWLCPARSPRPAPRALALRASPSLPWRPSGALRRLERPRSLLLLPSTPFGCLESPHLVLVGYVWQGSRKEAGKGAGKGFPDRGNCTCQGRESGQDVGVSTHPPKCESQAEALQGSSPQGT